MADELDPSTLQVLSISEAEHVPIRPVGLAEVLVHGVMVTMDWSSPPTHESAGEALGTGRGLILRAEDALVAAERIERAAMRALNAKKNRLLDHHDLVLREVYDFGLISNASAQRIALKFDVLVHGSGAADADRPETISYAVSIDAEQAAALLGSLAEALGADGEPG